MSTKKCIFITGHRKSGTSVFHKLFDNSPYVNTIPVDLTLFYAYLPIFSQLDTMHARKDRCNLILTNIFSNIDGKLLVNAKKKFSLEHFKNIFMKIHDFKSSSRGKLLTDIIDAWVKSNDLGYNKPIVVKETSQSIFYDELLLSEYKIKFLHLVRDPRDNFAAIKAGFKNYYSKLGETEVETLLSVIDRIYVDLWCAKNLSNFYHNDFRFVKFENLIENIDKTMKNIEEFLHLPYCVCHRTPTFLGEAYSGNNHEGKIFKYLTSKNIDAWRERITGEEAKIIELRLGELMEQFGYSKSFKETELLGCYSSFYDKYNTKLFFKDPFKN